MTPVPPSAPDWDLEQLEVIMDEPAAWQLVIAGPGAGKSAVACQRAAYLVDEGVAPSRILLVSFTRTAIAELRDCIVSFAVAGDRARSVRLSMIDSHAWSLRFGCDDAPLPRSLGNDSYDLNIERVVQLFAAKNADLLDFMCRLEHLVIDEAQDVVGERAQLVMHMLRMTGKKVEYQSIPYRSITRFSIETAGTFDLDAELKIWLTGNQAPIQLQFNKRLSIYAVQSVLAGYVLR